MTRSSSRSAAAAAYFRCRSLDDRVAALVEEVDEGGGEEGAVAAVDGGVAGVLVPEGDVAVGGGDAVEHGRVGVDPVDVEADGHRVADRGGGVEQSAEILV